MSGEQAAAEIEQLRAEHRLMKTALEFYGDAKNYEVTVDEDGYPHTRMDYDQGRIARTALGEREE